MGSFPLTHSILFPARKNWSLAYITAVENNLLIYKDEKAANSVSAHKIMSTHPTAVTAASVFCVTSSLCACCDFADGGCYIRPTGGHY